MCNQLDMRVVLPGRLEAVGQDAEAAANRVAADIAEAAGSAAAVQAVMVQMPGSVELAAGCNLSTVASLGRAMV